MCGLLFQDEQLCGKVFPFILGGIWSSTNVGLRRAGAMSGARLGRTWPLSQSTTLGLDGNLTQGIPVDSLTSS